MPEYDWVKVHPDFHNVSSIVIQHQPTGVSVIKFSDPDTFAVLFKRKIVGGVCGYHGSVLAAPAPWLVAMTGKSPYDD